MEGGGAGEAPEIFFERDSNGKRFLICFVTNKPRDLVNNVFTKSLTVHRQLSENYNADGKFLHHFLILMAVYNQPKSDYKW